MWDDNATLMYLVDVNRFLNSYCEARTLERLRCHFGDQVTSDGNARDLNLFRTILRELVDWMPHSMHGTPGWDWPLPQLPLLVMSSIRKVDLRDTVEGRGCNRIVFNGHNRLTVCCHNREFYLGFGVEPRSQCLRLVKNNPNQHNLRDILNQLPLREVDGLHPSQTYLSLNENSLKHCRDVLGEALRLIDNAIYDSPDRGFILLNNNGNLDEQLAVPLRNNQRHIYTPHGVITPRIVEKAGNGTFEIWSGAPIIN